MERLSINLAEQDLIAGVQLLAWVALPHRPQHGVSLLENWFWSRRAFRKQSVPTLPFALKKRSRFECQLRQFEANLIDGVRAGLWFQRHIFAKSPGQGALASQVRAWGASTRRLAGRESSRKGTEPGNEIRRIWSKRKPVRHLALAFGEVIADLHFEEGRLSFDLERTVFQPDWIERTLERAEELARVAANLNVCPIEGFYRFSRDNI